MAQKWRGHKTKTEFFLRFSYVDRAIPKVQSRLLSWITLKAWNGQVISLPARHCDILMDVII